MGRRRRNEENQAPSTVAVEQNGNNGVEMKEEDGQNEKEPTDVILLKVNIHCNGCANQIVKCLRGFDGVEDININSEDHKVMVKGKKADPLKVFERVRKKCNRHVELISPKPKPPVQNAKREEDNEPLVMIVVIKVHIHCENCAKDIKRSILKMEGVKMVEPDLKNSQMTVTGTFEPPKLVDFLYRRAGKHAVIVKAEIQEKERAKKRSDKEQNNGDQKGSNGIKEEKKDFYCLDSVYPPQYSHCACPIQMFSDENANACSIM